MENKNYYPLRLGTHQSSTYILTDTRTNDRHLDHEGCTGWVVAEGLPNLLAQQLVDAYNEKYEPKLPITPEIIVHHENFLKKNLGDYWFLVKRGEEWFIDTPEGYSYKENKKKGNALMHCFVLTEESRKKAMGSVGQKETTKEVPLKREFTDEEVQQIVSDHEHLIKNLDISTFSTTFRNSLIESINRLIRALVDNGTIKWGKGPASDPANKAQQDPVTTMFQNLKSSKEDELNRDMGLFTDVPVDFNDQRQSENPTIDHQIKLIEGLLKLSRAERSKDDYRILTGTKDPEKFPYTNHEKIYIGIINNLSAIKHWNESPAYHGEVDVEKVIEDLLEQHQQLMERHPSENVRELSRVYGPSKLDYIQNAEATLGMLKAFKENRFKKELPEQWTPEQVKEWMLKNPPQLVYKNRYIPDAFEMKQEVRDNLLRLIVEKLPSTASSNPEIKTANAIIFAVEEMLKLCGL